ncbi:MAG: glycerol acyltransferase [Bacteroidales bacterium]|jgi:putative hemolysin|nr:glycerol acyltransferase [Bacteroidales bacterium]
MTKYIDVGNIIQQKNERLYKILPHFVLSYFKRIIHENDLNADLTMLENLNTRNKFRVFLENRNFKVQVYGQENVPSNGRFMFTSNHPLGGLDGIAFYDTVASMYPTVKFLVNDILMNIPDVDDCFLPINKHGKNSREYFKKVDEACESDAQILSFPAGIVSRKINGHVQDLPWMKSCVSYPKKYKRDVIPVFIDGVNSNFFYNLANVRKRLGIRANLEMFFLVDELYKFANRSLQIVFGKPIPYTHFDSSKKDIEWAAFLREQTYKLGESFKENKTT